MRSQFSSCFIVSVFRSRSGMRQQQFALMNIGTVDPLLTPPSVAHCAMADAMCMNCMTCNSGYALCGGACVTPRLFWTFGLRQSPSHIQFMSPLAAFPNCAMMDPMCMMCKACNSGYILCNKACHAARSFSMRYFNMYFTTPHFTAFPNCGALDATCSTCASCSTNYYLCNNACVGSFLSLYIQRNK